MNAESLTNALGGHWHGSSPVLVHEASQCWVNEMFPERRAHGADLPVREIVDQLTGNVTALCAHDRDKALHKRGFNHE